MFKPNIDMSRTWDFLDGVAKDFPRATRAEEKLYFFETQWLTLEYVIILSTNNNVEMKKSYLFMPIAVEDGITSLQAFADSNLAISSWILGRPLI